MKRTVTLLILDGWGIGEKDYSNPIHIVNPEWISYLKSNYAIGSLQSAGIAVGLPWEEEGNSEVGHLTIGAGKVIYQHFPRITLTIESGEFFANDALKGAFTHVQTNNSAVHAAGLLSKGNVHASMQHIEALLDFASRQNQELYLHLFSDGKDSKPRSVMQLLEEVKSMIAKYNKGVIATIGGRHYAEDRDGHWNRTERAYQALTGDAPIKNDIAATVQEYYNRNLDDPYIEPFIVGPNANIIKSNDAVIFFDFREDSIRQIAKAFIQESFEEFRIKELTNMYFTTFTKYGDDFNVPVAFPADHVVNPLGKVLADNERTQVRIAETEKYAHVTYFMNGYQEQPFQNEYRILIPSRNVAHHDERPEMMTREISARIIESIQSRGFDCIIANFANSDMVAHTGNYTAAQEAIKIIDGEIGRIATVTLEQDGVLIITGDHGNIERVLDPLTGKPETGHRPNPVPFYLIGREFQRPKSLEEAERIEHHPIGLLSDIAPTILAILEVPKPDDMTGQDLRSILE
jgi:2,3-bisphosphoglycerate-independent phosphoglycerate mutase